MPPSFSYLGLPILPLFFLLFLHPCLFLCKRLYGIYHVILANALLLIVTQ